jgi:hypothetical protein
MNTQNTNITINLIFKTHLDIGFTHLAKHVAEIYVEQYLPKAIRLARELRTSGDRERFIWTVGSWLIYQGLEISSPSQKKELEQAIIDGDIVWHGLPFTTHTELLDASLFQHGLSLSQKLDRRFGRKTIAAKMTDVPGHTRSMIPFLAQAGIEFLHIGANAASMPAGVPPLFVWQHPEGANLTVMYHKGSYGDLMIPENFNQGICFAHTGDNLGPPTSQEIKSDYDRLRKQFPNAKLQASTLNHFAQALRTLKATLPVVTREIADTWIHGVGSDPEKVKIFKEYSRLRNRWLNKDITADERTAIEHFSDKLILIAEHTWGMDEKTHLADFHHYSKEDLAHLRRAEKTRTFEASWAEQRNYLVQARTALDQTSFAKEADLAIQALEPAFPNLKNYTQISVTDNKLNLPDPNIAFDPKTNAFSAGPDNPLGVFTYEIFSQADYDRFAGQYLQNLTEHAAWAIPDFTKPGIQACVDRHQVFHPILDGLYRYNDQNTKFLLRLHMLEQAVKVFGAPAEITLEIDFVKKGLIHYTLQLFRKEACRLPEAMWFSFLPRVASPDRWKIIKMNSPVSPLDVVEDGNRRLHAVEKCSYEDAKQTITLESLDAPLLAPGRPMLLNFTNDQPQLDQGMHFNLYNNVWGTNFPMWSEGNFLFRFNLKYS